MDCFSIIIKQTKMKLNFQNKISLLLTFISLQMVMGQDKKDVIKSETVEVVKSYNATVMDASKINESPSIENEAITKKEPIKYSIFSFPVASTFVPLKGKAEAVAETKQAQLFNNYATLAIGNYATINAELFVNQELQRDSFVGAMLRHLSTQGNIKDVDLSSNFSTNAVDVFYGTTVNNATLNFDAGFKKQSNNWYGLPDTFGLTKTIEEKNNLIQNINPKNSFNTFNLGGNLIFEEGVFRSAILKFNNFSDAFDTAENRFLLKPTFNFEVNDQAIKTAIVIDYVAGTFKQDYKKTNTEAIKYGYTNIGLAPSFEIIKNDWTLNLGLNLFTSLDSANSKTSFFVYPQVNAVYTMIDNLLFFYTGAEGGLEQNSYQNFIDINPFLSPTIDSNTLPNFIKPTDKQYDIFAGLKGKFTNAISYNLKASYISEKNKALFKSNDYTENSTNENYAFGNSFQVVYDNIKTLSFYGSIKANFSEDLSFGVSGTINSFTKDLEREVWNLPLVKLDSNLEFTIAPKWYAGLSVFYVGERKDAQQNTDIVFVTKPEATTLAGYVDLNAHLGYKYNNRLTGFLKSNNILNQNYQRWINFPVQGLQIMLGANYKFDF